MSRPRTTGAGLVYPGDVSVSGFGYLYTSKLSYSYLWKENKAAAFQEISGTGHGSHLSTGIVFSRMRYSGSPPRASIFLFLVSPVCETACLQEICMPVSSALGYACTAQCRSGCAGKLNTQLDVPKGDEARPDVTLGFSISYT